MIPIEEAQRVILDNVGPRAVVRVRLADAAGLVLAEDVRSDVDIPPFDKSAMDGFAVRAADLAELPAELEVIETVAAGVRPTRRIEPGQAAEIMTGAPVSEGADTVVKVEHSEPGSGPQRVRILKAPAAGANICPRGEDMARDRVALPGGMRVRAPEAAVLATVGMAKVNVFARPTVSVLATGDELVPPKQQPTGAQIRDCNTHAVEARLRLAGVEARNFGIVPDTEEELRRALREAMMSEVALITGGVSMGRYDFVPGILEELGVELLFRKVAIKPGLPTVFGRHARGVVFGLPGNPVAVLVTTEMFVLPALRAMMGLDDPLPPRRRAQLAGGRLSHKGDRPSYRPVTLSWGGGDVPLATPVEYHGTADIFGLAQGDAFAVVPAEVRAVEPGEWLGVIPWAD